ncbi:MAG: homoserine dehydrogenase [Promethearchaeota archaeon]|nr:MAG: homoserine dehydrogenase [Candidatus Lokiarchaeota archaeon]
MRFKIGLIGKGNVGSSFLYLLSKKRNYLKKKFDIELSLNAIFKSDGALINNRGLKLSDIVNQNPNLKNLKHWHDNYAAIDYISKNNFDIIIESTPTNPQNGEPCISHIYKALINHIDVITSNKAPFFLFYKKIKDLARKKNCFLKYDATVASCLPVISIKGLLLGSEIMSIKAILNGTSNYILSKMTEEQLDFNLAFQMAKELGYTETDPSLDIEGLDSAGKIVILANELLGWSKSIHDVQIKGISGISLQEVKSLSLNGQVIKPMSIAKQNKLLVEPQLIKKSSILNLKGSLNGIIFNTKYAGPIVLIGKGAGGFEAASAILNNLIEVILNRIQSV